MENNDFGIFGEEVAIAYLRKNGYTILATNWYFKHKEIDIIAEKEENKKIILVIVEVKSRSQKSAGVSLPYTSVTKKKQRYLIAATNAYIEKHEIDHEVRFDIISVVGDEKKYQVDHIPDAFYPEVARF